MEKENISFRLPHLFFNFKRMIISHKPYMRDIHFHNAIELVKINEGEMECVVGENAFLLKKGEIALIRNNVMHKLSFIKPADITYIQIDIENYFKDGTSSADAFINEFITSSHNKEYLISSNEKELSVIFDSFLKEVENRSVGYESYIKGYIQLLIAFMYRNGLLTDASQYYDTEKLKSLHPAIRYIEENFTKEISLDEISNVTNIDKYRLCRQFKEITGSTVVNYINFLRLRKASKELLTTDKAVGEIAFDSGFSTIQYFNKIFKNVYNCTPKTYRKQFSKK